MLSSTTVCTSEESCTELVLVSETQWHPNLIHIVKGNNSVLECSKLSLFTEGLVRVSVCHSEFRFFFL